MRIVEELLNTAINHYQSNQLDQAEDLFCQILEQEPEQAVALHFSGLIQYQKGDFNTASDLILRAVKIKPKYANAHHNLAIMLENQRQQEEAIKHYYQAVSAEPMYVEAYFNLARALFQSGRKTEALEQYKKLSAFNAGHSQVQKGIADTLAQQEQPKAAIRYYKKAIELNPYDIAAINNLGTAYRASGQHDLAKEAFRQVIAFQPASGAAYLNLAQIAPEFKESDWVNIHQALNQTNLMDTDRIYLNIALGLAYQKSQDYDQAFTHMQTGNSLYRSQIQYNHPQALQFLKSIENSFDHSYFECARPSAEHTIIGNQTLISTSNRKPSQSESPIFIMGMPRSGSTLVEQILSSHPDVFGAGETVILDNLLTPYIDNNDFARSLATIDDKTIAQLASSYLAQGQIMAGDSRVIANKKLDNYLFLGAIVRMFPNAKIIRCKRHPIDNCVSCFFNWFHTGQFFTFDLTELGEYYRAQEALMQHWQQVLPVPILEVQYEELIADQEATSRNLLSFCGLDWDSQCLSFYDNNRSVITNSDLQVRQPIYKSSVEKWRHYESHLSPLIDALRPV